MKILQITHQGDSGGSTNSITWLTRGLAERGHDVSLACRPESLIASRFADGSVRLLEARLPRGWKLAREARRWGRRLAAEGFDVVNAHASLDRHLLSYVGLARRRRTALVHTRRNVVLSTGGGLRARWDVATTDAVIAVSAEVRADLIRRGMPAAHVHEIRNGLPLSDLPAPDAARVSALRSELDLAPGTPVVGVVARRKSQDDLLRAARILGRPLEILCIGIPEDEELVALAAALPADCRARCLGFRDDVAELSALLDVFVLPSEIEGLSLALLEAMARGLPCLATDAGGNREALADGAGVVVPVRDPAALAKGLAGILADPDAARSLGARAQERALARFDVSRTVAETERLYERLVAGRVR